MHSPDCGCGQCSIFKFCDVGCPKPDKDAEVPVLSETAPVASSLNRFHLKGERKDDIKQMSATFGSLVNKTCESIKSKVTVEAFALWLKQLHAFDNVTPCCESTPSLLGQQIDGISQASSMERVFLILTDYWSWYNYSLLEEIINEYGDEEDQSRLDGFKKKYYAFAHNRIVEFSQHPMTFGAAVGDGKARTLLVFKVDRSWDTIHIGQLSEIHRNLASILKVKPHTLYLASIRKGCILVTFLIPSSVAQAVFPLSTSQKEALAATDIMLVKCGTHCHRFSPHSRPQVRNFSRQYQYV